MGAVQSVPVRAEDACPVDHRNMSDEQIKYMMEHYKKTGTILSHPPSAKSSESESTPSPKTNAEKSATNSGECPVDHKNMSEEQIAAYMKAHARHGAQKAEPTTEKDIVYDVYGQELDRSNMMPATPNQLPSPGQKERLSTSRVKSSIPKSGNTEETWMYPSEQMFYNAIMRKGKGDDVTEADMKYVVQAHNDTNEKTWKEVLEWERRFHCHECEHPKLKSFMGKPHDLSPAARFRMAFMRYPKPFDRHDWIVDRCGKGEARYIIDYYSREAPVNVELHVRPALDSPSAFYDRFRHRLDSMRNGILGPSTPEDSGNADSKLENLDVFQGDDIDADEFKFLSSLTPKVIEDISKDVQTSCANLGDAFVAAGTDPEKIEKANIAVNYCMAQRICSAQATKFMSALEGGESEGEAYSNMTSCLDRFQIMARRTLLKAAGVVQSGPEFSSTSLQTKSYPSEGVKAESKS